MTNNTAIISVKFVLTNPQFQKKTAKLGAIFITCNDRHVIVKDNDTVAISPGQHWRGSCPSSVLPPVDGVDGGANARVWGHTFIT